MAFVVRFFDRSNRPVVGGGGTWDVDKPRPAVPMLAEIDEVTATGRELDYVRLRFRNLPVTTGSECKWRGDLAAFVYDNL